MAAFLSEQWVQRLAGLGADLDEVSAMSMRVQHVVGDAPDGEVRYTVDYADGRITGAALGGGDDADIGLSTKYADARAVLDGDLDANALFISGRTKVTGDTGPLLAYLARVAAPDHQAHRQALAAVTDP